jgi:hypothetical protein
MIKYSKGAAYRMSHRKRDPMLLRMAWILLMVGIGLVQCAISAEQAGNCGMSLPLKISYQPGASSAEYPQYPDPTVTLRSVLPSDNHSTVLIRLDRPSQKKRPTQYVSYDRGETWQPSDWTLGYSNLRKWSISDYLMSHVDHNVLYDCYYKCKDGFERSKDGGKTWMHVNPTVSGGSAIDEIELIETGMHSANRVYARVWIGGAKDFRCAVSNDFGQTFDLLPEEVKAVVESRAEPTVWYGMVRSSPWLAISRDSGLTWQSMEGSREFWQPIYRNPVRKYFRSWKQYPEDIEDWSINPIDQLESDPRNPNLIYVLTRKGLYLSRNAGKTFRLSSLARGRLNSIDRIAVDPVNGRFIYAVVDLGQFYRSSDYGCSWERMKVPPVPR